MADSMVEIAPATKDRWPDLVDLFGKRGVAARCWCQWDIRADSYNTPEAREDLRDQMGRPVPPGVLAYADGLAVGWLRICPLADFTRILASRGLAKLAAGPDQLAGTWLASCFVVRVGHRRQGVASALLRGGIEVARERGARRVIGRPVDLAVKGKASSNDLYVGALTTFLKAGFREIGRLTPQRPLVELLLG